jgi:hypothetical protein
MESLKNLTLMQWIGIAIGLNSLFMGATPQLTVLFGSNAVPYIVALATLGNGALGVFVTVIGGQGSQLRNVLAMPGVERITVNGQANSTLATMAVDQNQNKIAPTVAAQGAVTATAKAAAVLLFAVVLGCVAFAGNASAQAPKLRPLTGNIGNDLGITKPVAPMITGNVEKDLQALWDKIVASSIADLNYAAAMAKSANTQTSGIRLQCINAIITLNQQASGANLKNPDGTPMVKPDPHLFTDVESLAEVIDNLSPQGPLFVNCAGAAQLAKTNVLTFVNAVVTGAAGFAAMPVIPGL